MKPHISVLLTSYAYAYSKSYYGDVKTGSVNFHHLSTHNFMQKCNELILNNCSFYEHL